MLKSFYKTFLISILCGSLTLLNVPLYADEVPNSDQPAVQPQAGSSEPNQKATALMSKSNNPNLTRDANGVITSHENKSFSGAKVDDDGPLHIITMLAVGVIGTKLLTYKKWTTDMTIVAAASAAYIAAEIVNIMNLKKEIKGMSMDVTRSSDGKVDQTQIETLEKLKESYQKVQKSAQTKKMLQTAAGVAFGAATAVAAWQAYSEEGKFASCEAAIDTATAKLEAAAAATTVDGEAASMAACVKQLEATKLAVTKYKTECLKAGPSYLTLTISTDSLGAAKTVLATECTSPSSLAIQNTFVTPACGAYLGVAATTKAGGNPQTSKPGGWITPKQFEKMFFNKGPTPLYTVDYQTDAPTGFKKYLEKSLEFIFPKAHAGVIASLGLVGAAATTYFATENAISRTIDNWMHTPLYRIGAWTFMAGAALYGANQTDKEIKRIGGEIEKIDKILKDLGTLKKGIKANNVTDQQINLASVQAMQGEEVPLSVNSKEKMDCLVSSGANKCTALTDTLKAMPGFADLPDSLKNIASQSAQLGDGLSGSSSISGSTLGTANSLAGKQNAIAKLNNSLKNKINDALSKSKQPTIDFDKKANELAASLKATTQKALASRGTNGAAFLTSMGINPSSVSAPSSNTASLNTMKKSSFPGTGGAGTAAPAKEKDKDFALDFKETGVDGTGAAAGAEGSGWGKDNFDIGSNDINTNSGESIFQVISNRYIKSGYPRLLDEIPAAKN